IIILHQIIKVKFCSWLDSNHRPPDYESAVLPLRSVMSDKIEFEPSCILSLIVWEVDIM
ncbi:hypothetical protein WDU94_003229, partial [Cyamophila willieti]